MTGPTMGRNAPQKHTNQPLSVTPDANRSRGGSYIAYYRVSTEKQGRSGLGLDAQREAVSQFLGCREGSVISEFVEIESGRKSDRPQLTEALSACKRLRAILLIAKLDRLARSVAFVAGLMEGDVEFVAADMPEASKFVLHIMAAVAEHERQLIGERTRAALAAAKARGIKLGSNGAALATKHRREAAAFAETLYPHVQAALLGGARSYASIAANLNSQGLLSREGGKWHSASVGRLLKRLSDIGFPEIRVANDSGLAKFGQPIWANT
jgi:DNA invertase Pin-like site-specific DNA recombinase